MHQPTHSNEAPLVLVVDDEAAIREAVRDILELADVETVLAANGREAIECFEAHRDRIRAVLLDLRMPVMSGTETYMHLRAMDPSVVIVLSSGYDDKDNIANFEKDPAVFFLRKPYAMDTLIARIHEALAS